MLLFVWGAPAHAQNVPSEPVEIHLKDHDDLMLGEKGGELMLTAEADEWRFTAVEALLDLGEYQIVHHGSGQCLTADTSGGAETAPVSLADCVDAITWQIVFDDRPSHSDYRFVTADGYFLGLEDDTAIEEGAEVLAIDVESGISGHSQEWWFGASSPEDTPAPDAIPSEAPAEVTVVSDPKLPTTGVGLGAAAGAGVVALGGGAALVVWWQRRRALRSHW